MLALRKDFLAMSAQPSYLLNGPLLSLADDRRRLVAQMTAELLAHNAFASRGDAIQTLRDLGHAPFDMFLLVDDAIYGAKQDVLAREISAP